MAISCLRGVPGAKWTEVTLVLTAPDRTRDGTFGSPPAPASS